MEQADISQCEANSVELIQEEILIDTLVEEVKIAVPDPQVKVGGSPKRKFTAQYQQKILNDYNACSTSLEHGALLRREGLYSSHITRWRQLFSPANDASKGTKAQRTEHLVSEIEQLKKKLAQAQAIIDLQKKVSELLGTYILPHESNVGKS